MLPASFTEEQQKFLEVPPHGSIFLEGDAGTGKTICAIARLKKLLTDFQGHQILVLVPQRSLGAPYEDFIHKELQHSGSLPSILTLGGLSRRMIALFWPMISKEAGFSHPEQPPQFLSIETAQYCMEKAISQYLDQGFFQSVVLSRNRLYGQILDNLNKSAFIRFPVDEISLWLKSVANLDAGLTIAFDQVVICAKEFRKFCYANNLLDYSLQVDVFINHLWKQDVFKEYFFRNFRALIADNIEEDVPATHDLIKEWLPDFDSSLVIYDNHGGYRSFLGADPTSALSIKSFCGENEHFEKRIEYDESLSNFSKALNECISHENRSVKVLDFKDILKISDFHFYPEMIAGICSQIDELINTQGVNPEEIVVLSPYLSDALNFSLSTSFKALGISHHSSRPSQMYIDDPKVRAFFTFAKMAHPQWPLPISVFGLRDALMVVLPELDIVRADLIVRTLFTPKQSQDGLRSFDTLTQPAMQERITFKTGENIEGIRIWMKDYQEKDPLPLDVFFSLIFGELFSQKNYSFFSDPGAASRLYQIIQSIRIFRQFMTQGMGLDDISAGFEYMRSVENGLLPSAIHDIEKEPENAVLIAPAHTFLMENRKVDYQFWLDIGSLGWWERLNQPLTNPYLLNRNRDQSQVWTEAHEYNANQAGMLRIIEGLVNRCGKMIFVNSIRTNENGSEQRGPLLQAFHTLQKRVYQSKGGSHV